MSTTFLSCTYETYNQESRRIFNVATPHSSPISSTWGFYYSLKRNSLSMMCVQIPGVLDRLLNYSTRMRLYHRSGYEPCQYPEIPGHTRTRWPLRLSNPCRIAVKVVGYGGHVLSPPSLQPSNPPPVCRCSLEIILLRFHLLLLSKSFKLMQIDKFSRFWTPNFTITFSWAGSSSFDGGLMWCIFDVTFCHPKPFSLSVSFSHIPTSLSSDLKSGLYMFVLKWGFLGRELQDVMVVDMEWCGAPLTIIFPP